MTDLELTPDEHGSYTAGVDPGEPSTGEPRVSVTDAEAALLAELVAGLAVLELGTGLAVSTRAMAATAVSVHTVDPDPWVHDHVWPRLPGNVTTSSSLSGVLPATFGAVFVDGDHRTEAARLDIRLGLSVLPPTGLLIVHDGKYPSVRAALEAELPPASWELHPTRHGVATYRLGDS